MMKPKSLEVTKSKVKVKQRAFVRSASVSIPKVSTILFSETKQGLEPIPKAVEIFALKPVTIPAVREKSLLIPKTSLKLRTATKLKKTQKRAPISRTPLNVRLTTTTKIRTTPKPPRPKPMFDMSFDGGRTKKSKGQFTTEVRRKGVFKPVGEFFTLGKAVGAGKKKTSKTLAASFRVTKGGKVVPLKEDMFFKKAKKEKGVLVQKKTARLSAYGERREIQQARSRAKWL